LRAATDPAISSVITGVLTVPYVFRAFPILPSGPMCCLLNKHSNRKKFNILVGIIPRFVWEAHEATVRNLKAQKSLTHREN